GFAGPNRFLTSPFLSSPFSNEPWRANVGGFAGLYYTPDAQGNQMAGDQYTATWTTTVTANDTLGKNDSGLEVSATWPASSLNSDHAQYRVSVNGNLVDTVTVNQQLA